MYIVYKNRNKIFKAISYSNWHSFVRCRKKTKSTDKNVYKSKGTSNYKPIANCLLRIHTFRLTTKIKKYEKILLLNIIYIVYIQTIIATIYMDYTQMKRTSASE